MSPSTSPQFRHSSFHGRIGVARTDITPPVGGYCRNWGAARHDVAASIHRPLTMTALTLQSLAGEQSQVLVEADLFAWHPETYRKFRLRLLDALRIEPANLIFAISHTHSAPPLMEHDKTLPGCDLLQAWIDTLVESTVHAVSEARSAQFEATLDWHTGRCDLATVRDFPDPDPARKRFLCGYNPDRVADDTLLVGRITDSTGRLRATLTNYG